MNCLYRSEQTGKMTENATQDSTETQKSFDINELSNTSFEISTKETASGKTISDLPDVVAHFDLSDQTFTSVTQAYAYIAALLSEEHSEDLTEEQHTKLMEIKQALKDRELTKEQLNRALLAIPMTEKAKKYWRTSDKKILKAILKSALESNPAMLEAFQDMEMSDLRKDLRAKKIKENTRNILLSLKKEYDIAEKQNKRIKKKEAEKAAEQRTLLNAQKSFETEELSMLEAQDKANLEFDALTRADRANWIARLFSNEITDELENKKRTLELQKVGAGKEELKEINAKIRNLSRIAVINELTPIRIFNMVKQLFEGYVNDTYSNRVNTERAKIDKMKGADKYNATEEGREKMSKYAIMEAERRTKEYTKIIENFDALARDSTNVLSTTEKILVDYKALKVKEMEDSMDEEITDKSDVDALKEEQPKESWSTGGFRKISAFDSLSQDVRTMLSRIPKIDKNGKKETDDFGHPRTMKAEAIYNQLMEGLQGMTSSKEFFPALEKMAETAPWVNELIKMLKEDNTGLTARFYQNFRKDAVRYGVHTKSKYSKKWKTVNVNKINTVQYLLDAWRENYEEGVILNNYSIYGTSGEINQANADKNDKKMTEVVKFFTQQNMQDQIGEIENEGEIFKLLIEVLNALGIDIDSKELKDILLYTDKNGNSVLKTKTFDKLTDSIYDVLRGVERGDVKGKINDQGTKETPDLLNTFDSAYSKIAKILSPLAKDAIEAVHREGKSSYLTYVTPSYLGKLIKRLKNSISKQEIYTEDMSNYTEFLEKEFKQFDAFYDKSTNTWINDWLKQLEESEKAREVLDHLVVLNANKKEYKDWDALDYMLVLLNQYWGVPDNNASLKQAWYHMPIMSDADSAEFIKFYKYDNNTESGKTFQDIISEKFIEVVLMEYKRRGLVIKRNDEFQAGNTAIKPIDEYDIVMDDKGELVKKGGSVFQFFPQLNTYEKNEEKFIDILNRMFEKSNNVPSTEIKQFIQEVLREIIEEGFEQDFIKMNEIGLLDKGSDGKYIHLHHDTSDYHVKRMSKVLANAKKLLEDSWTTEMEEALQIFIDKKIFNDTKMRKTLDLISAELLHLKESGLITNSQYLSAKDLKYRNLAKEALREYYWNSKFATSQIIQITNSDLAFFGSFDVFQKRNKQNHSPGLRLYTEATLNGEKVGRDIERRLVISDEVIVSEMIEDLEELFQAKVDRGEMTSLDKDYIVSQFNRVNVTDGQSYRSLSSYRAVLNMAGKWGDIEEHAYQNFLKGEWDISDFNVVFQQKKPFMYTQVGKNSGIEGYSDIKVPIQDKNSEFPLMALYSLVAGELGKSEKMRAITDFMENNDYGIDEDGNMIRGYIDVMHFGTVVKVGQQGKIDLSDVHSYHDVLDRLYDTAFPEGIEDVDFIQQVPYEDYGIQMETPEHFVNAMQLVGTQLRKLIASNIDPKIQVTIGDKVLTKQQWIDFYNRLITENIIESFQELHELFGDAENVEKALLKELQGNSRYDLDLIKSCALNKDGKFELPLFEPVQSIRIQYLLHSVIKNTVTKQKMKGGGLYQVSNYGYTDDLNIVWEGEGKSKRVKYYECYLPAYLEDFFAPYLKNGSHVLANDLPEELRKLIGYRIPTEATYSMMPLYIKGFLPQQNGSSIMLPAEITTITGANFDIDKLYILLPDFKTKKIYDLKQAWIDFYEAHPEVKDKIIEITHKIFQEDFEAAIEQSLLNPLDVLGKEEQFEKRFFAKLKELGITDYMFYKETQRIFSEWFDSQKDEYYIETKFSKVEFEENVFPEGKEPIQGERESDEEFSVRKMIEATRYNNKAARNNMLLDLMYGMLTNEKTAASLVTPGGFENIKKTSLLNDILKHTTKIELVKNISELFKKEGIDKKVTPSTVLDMLFKLDLDQIKELAKATVKEVDPLSPMTQIEYQQRNMTGANLIGVYANHNTNHALAQHTKMRMVDSARFTLNGKSNKSLHEITSADGVYISKLLASFFAASVDNAKDSVLMGMNQNSFTVDVTTLLARLGYKELEISLLMNQPIVLKMTKEFFRKSREGYTKEDIINLVLKEYKEKALNMGIQSSMEPETSQFTNKELAANILMEKEVIKITQKNQSNNFDVVNFYNNQIAVGFLFRKIYMPADHLAQNVGVFKVDAFRSSSGPDIASTRMKLLKLNKYMESSTKRCFTLLDSNFVLDIMTDAEVINPETGETELDLEDLREYLYDRDRCKLPYMQAFQTFGLSNVSVLFKDYFPQYLDSFENIVKTIEAKTKREMLDEATVNKIYNELMLYIMRQTDFFGTDENTTSEQKSKDFIVNFPKYFKSIKKDNPDIAELEFIKRLTYIKANKVMPVDTLVFKNVGSLTPALRANYMRDWESLLYMKNPKAQQLALNLFRYSTYRNGFAFGPNTFIHLASTLLKKAVPEYVETLEKILKSEDTYIAFIDQFMYNHLYNRKLVPEVPSTQSSFNMFDKNGNPKDEFEVSLTRYSTALDKKYARTRTEKSGYIEYEFFEYIAIPYGNDYVYYRKGISETQQDLPVNRAVYTKIKPLGLKYNFLEYAFNTNVLEMKSVIPKVDPKITRESVYTEVDYSNMPEIENAPFSNLEYFEAYEEVEMAPINRDIEDGLNFFMKKF